MRTATKRKPERRPVSIVPKVSETKRPYMKRRYGHRLRALKTGKPIYFPPRVFNELQDFCVGWAAAQGVPYGYTYEVIWDLLRNA